MGSRLLASWGPDPHREMPIGPHGQWPASIGCRSRQPTEADEPWSRWRRRRRTSWRRSGSRSRASRARRAASTAATSSTTGSRSRGYEVFAVNPNADTVDGEPCFRDLAAIPGGVDAVVIATAPDAAADVVAECERLGITRVWMHRSFGGGSVSKEAARAGRQAGITVDRRRLSADVRAHRGRRAQVHALGARVHLGQAHSRLRRANAAALAESRSILATWSEVPGCAGRDLGGVGLRAGAYRRRDP